MSVLARVTDAVTVLPLNETPSAGGAVIAAGGSYVFTIENVTKTDSVYSSVDDEPALAATLAIPVAGNLVGIAVNTYFPLIQVSIDERMLPNAQWLRSDQFLVTPYLPTFSRAFRFIAHMAKITFYNGGVAPAVVSWGVRVSSS